MVVFVVLDDCDPFFGKSSLGDENLHGAPSLPTHAITHSRSRVLLEVISKITSHLTCQQNLVGLAILQHKSVNEQHVRDLRYSTAAN